MEENKAYLVLKDNIVKGLVYGLKPVMKGYEVIEITLDTYINLAYEMR
jgi:hypothetical protein